MSTTKIIAGFTTTALALLALGYHLNKRHTQPKDPSILTIGILQTASHPALDAAREGFVDQLKKDLGSDKIEFIVQNGQGSVQQLHTMAQSFHANKNIDAIFAIATPAAQAMAHVEKNKPIMIAAVTDPHSAGLIHPRGNVCGTQDMVDAESIIEMLMQLVPKTQTVALLYNPGEVNSRIMVEKFQATLSQHGRKALLVGLANESEVPAAISMACNNADVLLAPTDNLVAVTLPLIADRAAKSKRPLIVSDNELVKHGALAACGINYFVSGQQSALVALQVLVDKKQPSTIPIVAPTCDTIVLNKKVMETLGIVIPKTSKKIVLID